MSGPGHGGTRPVGGGLLVGLCRGHRATVFSWHLLVSLVPQAVLWQMTPSVSSVPLGQALSLLAAPRNLEGARRLPGSWQAQPLLCTGGK